MPKKKSKAKMDNKANDKVGGDFHLSEKHYEQLEEYKIFETEKRVAKIFGIKNRISGEKFINIKSKSRKPFGWHFNFGVSLYDTFHINSLFQGLRLVAEKLGWHGIKSTEDIEVLKIQLREKEESILTLEKANEEERASHSKLMERFKHQQQEILRIKQKDFRIDVNDLSDLIAKTEKQSVSEGELQEFLFNHSWLFGTEYINAEPQKLRGAHSKFDFYLERFNKTNDIVEIKLLSDQIINIDGSISAKVIQAVDQLIDYMESSQAAAHSRVISEEEGIHELRPRGIVIIGRDSSELAKKKLHIWNYQFAHITILTYFDIFERAKSVLDHLQTSKN